MRFTDRVGKPVTNGLGLTTSRFDYVTSTMTSEDWERARTTASERKLTTERLAVSVAQVKADDETAQDVGAAKGVL